MPKKKKTETQKYQSQELERRRRLVVSKQRKMTKLAGAVKILSERKFKSQRAKNNQMIRIYVMMVRIRVIQGQVLMVISQPLHKYPQAIPIHPNFGNEIAHVNLEGEKIIIPAGEAFKVPKVTMMDLPVPESIQAILSRVNGSVRIFPNFDNMGKTDEGVY